MLLSKATRQINISIHVLILFTFLTILFFTFISKLEQKSVSTALKSAVNHQTTNLLTGLDTYLGSIGETDLIEWDKLDKIAKEIKHESIHENKKVKENHKRLNRY